MIVPVLIVLPCLSLAQQSAPPQLEQMLDSLPQGENSPPDNLLRIPGQATQNLSFLEGCWITDPFKHFSEQDVFGTSTYCFDAGGRGSLLYKRPGMTCRLAASATFRGNRLQFTDSDGQCMEGSAWWADNLDCQRGDDGIASCSGFSTDRNTQNSWRWTVTLRRAAVPDQQATNTTPKLPSAGVTPDRSGFWEYSGSTISLSASGEKRSFYLETPSQGMRELGVHQYALLFVGTRNGGKYQGTAYAFSSHCNPAPYGVTGVVSNDDRKVTLTGKMPLRNSQCQITGFRDEVIEFVFHDQADNWGQN